jgi:hypothetical protein
MTDGLKSLVMKPDSSSSFLNSWLVVGDKNIGSLEE